MLRAGENVDDTINDGSTALIISCERANLDLCRVLVEHKANLNAANKTGDTALSAAAAKGSLPICRLLLDSKCNPHGKLEGVPPLYAAAKSGNVDVCKAILDARADPNALFMVQDKGWTALRAAKHFGQPKVVELLSKVCTHVVLS